MVRRRKVALHTSSHLTPTEAWRSPDSTTSEGHRVSSEVRLENCTQVWEVGQIWTACDSRLRKNSASHLFWLVQTCQNFSEPVRNTVTMYARRTMSFFALSNALILQSYVLSCWNCFFNSPNRELSNGVRVMALYRSKIVDPSRSPCFKTVDSKSLERRNFLMLRPFFSVTSCPAENGIFQLS